MVNFNDAFAGKDPDFMDSLFPDLDWRECLSRSKSEGGWSWFWNTFAPYGMLMSEDPGQGRFKTKNDMAPALLSAIAKGFLKDTEPSAMFISFDQTLHYWPLLKDGLTDDLLEYSDAVAEGDAVDV